MNKILKVTKESVLVGMEDGSTIETKLNNCNFKPSIGDAVSLYQNGDEYIVSREETKASETTVVIANKKPVDKVTYALLALFLGGIGIHKIYAGKTGSFILYLLLSWTFIPSIVAFVEFIIALCQTSDTNGNILV